MCRWRRRRSMRRSNASSMNSTCASPAWDHANWSPCWRAITALRSIASVFSVCDWRWAWRPSTASHARASPTRQTASIPTCGVFSSHFLIHSQLIIARRQEEKAGFASSLNDAQLITPSIQSSISKALRRA